MANVGTEKHEVGESEQIRKQLAVAVRSVRWSYAIFWSLSSTQQGVLKWHDGYYNGDIKTRKTVQPEDFKPERIGLQRSEQLRELYNSLLEGNESEEGTCNKKPPVAASLSPEDLSDMEWYYLVCMSFVFNPGEDLPGRAFSRGETIWLCNAHYADSKVFSRSLLAKSASIQTVVCFPYLGGVIELGITELVSKDTALLQHVKACLLKLSKPVCYEKSSSSTHKSDDDDGGEQILTKAGPDNVVHGLNSKNFYEGCKIDSFEDCLIHGCDQNNGMEDSTNSTSDCISEAFEVNQPKDKTSLTHFCLKEVQISNHTKFSSLDLGEVEQEGEGEEEDKHYKITLFTILGSSPHLQGDLGFLNSGCNSSFSRWKKGAGNFQKPIMAPQRMLKKVLCRENNSKDSLGIDDETRENEKLGVLRSMLPPINKIDKALILNDTIKYLKALEARVQELEAVMEVQISDNYDKEKIESTKRPLLNKRKAYDIDETSSEVNQAGPENRVVKSEVQGRAIGLAETIRRALWNIASK